MTLDARLNAPKQMSADGRLRVKQGLGQKVTGRTRGKNQKGDLLVNQINQIETKTAWTNPLPVDQTAFLDSAASFHLLHNRAPANISKEQEKRKTCHNSKRVQHENYGNDPIKN